MSSTRDETSGFTIYWRIENFSSESYEKGELYSPMFFVKPLKSMWRLEMHKENDDLSVFLINKSNVHGSTLSYSTFLLVGTDWKTLCSKENESFGLNRGWGCRVQASELEREEWIYLPNGSLTISFRVWNYNIQSSRSQCLIISRLKNNQLKHRPIKRFSSLKPSDMLSYPPSYAYNNDRSHQNAGSSKSEFIQTDAIKVISQFTQTDGNADLKTIQELRKLFSEGELSFVTLRTLCKDFSVHKAVLCAKSPVFKAMFEQNMRENEENVVDIDDIDSGTLDLLIKSLHFEPIGDLTWEAVVKLYYAADKYQIDALKKDCARIMGERLSVENVCDVFKLADKHNDEELLKCAQEYFDQNSKIVLTSEQWRDFMCYTNLAADVLCTLAKKM